MTRTEMLRRKLAFWLMKPMTESYSHWDLLATARIIDPKAWREFDDAHEADPNLNYYNFDTGDSINAAVRVVRSGFRPSPTMLRSDADLNDWVTMTKRQMLRAYED